MARTLASVATAVDGRLIGSDSDFGAVCTDTRKLERGALFVAIRGEHFDGNDFVDVAAVGGAAGALVSRVARSPLAQIAVPDTRAAFAAMAKRWRENFSVPVVAITGSSGKTTVKELTAGILAVRGKVCVTQGNLNNEIGVPITLMRAAADDDAIVVELGANHAGEIDALSAIVEPTVGVITNAGPAHLEGFGSLEGVAAAKGELLDHLAPAAWAVLNADDRFWREWRARASAANIVSFGLGAEADCTVDGEPEFGDRGTRFTMRMPGLAPIEVELPLPGRHNVVNALAAAAAARAAGANADDIRRGLAVAAPVGGRLLTLEGRNGTRIIDDSYNANPSSVRAALDYLAVLPGRRLLVLGDMLELGAEARALHGEVGAYAAGKCDELVAIGSLAAEAAAAFGPRGYACPDIATAAELLESRLEPDLTVLIKGSRAMGLEALVRELRPHDDPEGAAC